MDSTQPVLAALFVLALLGGALYLLRAKGLARFNGRILVGRGAKQMQSIERLPLTPQHSLHLVSVAGRTLLVAVSPGACTVVDGMSFSLSSAAPNSNTGSNIMEHR
jgi:flagellar biogenesis protein FliO